MIYKTMIVCRNRECGFKKEVYLSTSVNLSDIRCPDCNEKCNNSIQPSALEKTDLEKRIDNLEKRIHRIELHFITEL